MNPDTTLLSEGIAVIGMAGHFPGAPNLDAYWENLRQGVESITHFAEHELDVPLSISQKPEYVRARGIIDGVDLFDADFFGLNPREAEYTDPQHRLLLETAVTALENAACDPDRFIGNIGVFAGCSLNSYLLHNLASNPEFLNEFISSQQMGAHPSLLGNDKDFLVTRLSYKLNLRGPSVAVQSACSTSLVAVVQACQSLLNFQCDVALAGGVSVTFPQRRGYAYEEGSIVSSDGRCRPFDAAAGGTVFGDGVGLVVLKRADEAMRDGDHIHAIIRGFAVNNDGSGKVSYMAPSVDGQAEAIATAQALAGIDVSTIRYVEAHGTGTSLGDPIEVAALTKAFRVGTKEKQFCTLGAVKGNIGHLEAAAGVAGLIKAILVVKNGEIPPTLHFTQPNPRIDFANSPFSVAAKLQSWPVTNAPRRAGVSSFGVGGTNAHVVLEQAPSVEKSPEENKPQLLVLSAKTPTALDEATKQLGDYLKLHPELLPAEVAATLQTGRRAFRHRRAWVGSTIATAAEPEKVFTGDTEGRKGSVAFMFPGQGAQRVGMGQELYDTNAVFRENVDRCCALLAPELGLDLRTVLYPSEADAEGASDRLMQTSLTQPALFVMAYAMAQAWIALGVKPQVMVGHSLGEYVAATLAGIFTLDNALHLLAIRGRLMQSLPSGTMLAVVMSETDLLPLLTDGLNLASVNSPKSCVVSGSEERVAAFAKKLEEQGIASKELRTSHAFHSAAMDPILAEFKAEVARVPRQKPQIPMISSLYGRLGTDEEWMSPAYWSGQLRHVVRFADAVEKLMSQPGLALLEVGPGQTLTALARQNPALPANQATIASSPRTCRESEANEFLSAAGQLWIAGVEIDWQALHGEVRPCRVPLPTYTFQRQRYWIEAQRTTVAPSANTNGNGHVHDVVTNRLEVETNGHDMGVSEPSSELEALIQEQLRIMAQQIEVLRSTS